MLTAMADRPKTVSIRFTHEELARADALAEATDQSINQLVRRLLAEEYARREAASESPRSLLATLAKKRLRELRAEKAKDGGSR